MADHPTPNNNARSGNCDSTSATPQSSPTSDAQAPRARSRRRYRRGPDFPSMALLWEGEVDPVSRWRKSNLVRDYTPSDRQACRSKAEESEQSAASWNTQTASIDATAECKGQRADEK